MNQSMSLKSYPFSKNVSPFFVGTLLRPNETGTTEITKPHLPAEMYIQGAVPETELSVSRQPLNWQEL